MHRRIVQALLQLDDEPAHGETNTDAASGNKEKLQARLRQGEHASYHGGHCETERDERSGVVYETFAFKDDNNFARHPQILRNCQRCHRVGRRDNRPEYKTYRQR